MPPAAMAGWEGIGEREVSRPWSWRDRREGVVPPLELAGQEREGLQGVPPPLVVGQGQRGSRLSSWRDRLALFLKSLHLVHVNEGFHGLCTLQ